MSKLKCRRRLGHCSRDFSCKQSGVRAVEHTCQGLVKVKVCLADGTSVHNRHACMLTGCVQAAGQVL